VLFFGIFLQFFDIFSAELSPGNFSADALASTHQEKIKIKA